MSTQGKIGISAVTYLNVGNFGTPNWSAVTCISEWSLNVKWDSADASTRGSRAKQYLKTMVDLEVSGKVRSVNSGDTNYAALLAAAVNDTLVDVLVLNGDKTTNGVSGFRFAAQVFDASEDQGLGSVIFDAITLKPAPNTDGNTSSALVATGAPVFTAL